MNNIPYHRMTNYVEHMQNLQLACEWMDIKKGRASQYQKFIKEFYDEDIRSREHILAYKEGFEITNIYELWKSSIANFPGLEQKVKQIFKKGPILREDERPDTSSNRPRNDAFVFLLAGNLIKSGVKVIAVDGIIAQGYSCDQDADITFVWQDSPIDIQCKRPQSEQAITKRVKEARQQLRRGGIIALDCSAFVLPGGHLIESSSELKALKILDDAIDSMVIPKVAKHLDFGFLGFLVFGRAPALIRVGHSAILSYKGNNIVYIRRDCISTWLAIVDETSPNIEILRSVYLLLKQAIYSP